MAEALRDLRSEKAQKTGELIDIEELYRRRGEKALAAARAEKPDEGGQLVEFRRDDDAERRERVLIDDKVDRFGNPAYSKKTLENLQEKGIEQDPAEAERVEQIEAARVASAAERKEKILEVLNGRSPEFAIQEMQSDIGKWEAEIAEIKSEPASEGGRMEIAHDQQMISEMQARITLIESITPKERAELDRELGTDVIVDTYEDGTTTVREAMPVTTAMADEDFAAEVAKIEGPIEVGAASGELDMNNPLDTDEWRIRQQAVEILKNTRGIPKDLIASVEQALQDAEESTVREARKAEGFLETEPEEMAAGPRTEDVEPVTREQVRSNNNRGEMRAEQVDRAELQAKVQEKLQKRPGVRHRMHRAAATVLLTVTTMATAFAGSKMTAEAAHANQSGGGMRIEANENSGAMRGSVKKARQKTSIVAAETLKQLGEAGSAQMMDLVGNLNQDDRYEAENGTRYRYDEFDSTEKHGRHGFGTDKSEFWGDIDGTRNSILEINRAQPEVLAATVSHLPSVLTEAGLDANLTKNEIDDLLSNQDGGAELQERLYRALEEKLGDANTTYEFYQEYRQEYSSYIKNSLGDGELSTPENLQLGTDVVQRNGEKQVRIGTPVYNDIGAIDHYEWLDLNSECGWQDNEEIEQAVRQQAHEDYIEQVAEAAIQRAEAEQEQTWINLAQTEESHEDQSSEEQTTGKQEEQEETEGGEGEKEKEEETEEGEKEKEEEDGENGEEVKQKSLENEERLMQGEGTSAEVTKTEDVTEIEEVTDQHENTDANQGVKTENAQADANASAEEQEAAAEAQENAEENKITEDISDEDFDAYNNNFEARVLERQAEEADAAAEAAAENDEQ